MMRHNLLGSAARFAIVVAMANWSDGAAAQLRDDPSGTPAGNTSVAPAPPSASDMFDIVVTARKREESLQDSPIAISAFGDKFLDNYNVQSVDDLTSFSPGLLNFERPGYQASGIYLRGIGTTVESALAEGSVAIVIDGIQVPGFMQRAAGFDLARIEVLRGPQALFYGKGTPAGVISMVSSAASDAFQLSGNVGYEFQGREKYGEAVVSGPLSETLSARAGIRYSNMRGYYKLRTLNIPGLIEPLPSHRAPDKHDLTLRGSLKWEPSSKVDATISGLFFDQRQHYGVNEQVIYCPNGTRNPAGPFGGSLPGIDDVEDCKANDKVVLSAIPNVVLDADPHFQDSKLGLNYNKSYFGAATLNFRPLDNLTLTSVTGYLHTRSGVNASYSLLPTPNFTSSMRNRSKQFSEELRLASRFDGAINFLLGGFYEYSNIDFNQRVQIALPNGTGGFVIVGPLPTGQLDEAVRQKRDFYSAFGQAILTPIEHWELDVGGRYSHDSKTADYSAPLNVPGASRDLSRSFNNFSPEVTLQFKPNRTVNLYGSYKRGFKSGGLSGATFRIITYVTNPAVDVASMSYGAEKAKGFEVGSKLTLGRLRLNGAAFTYAYNGLQLSSFDPALAQFTIRNAGSARVKGLEGDFNWQPDFVDDLTLFGSIGYVHARYTDFIAPCYDGQSISQGCNLDSNNDPVNPRFQSQNLTGRQLRGAPDWTATLGLNYETTVGSRAGIGFSADGAYTSSYPVILSNQPGARQLGIAKINATARIFTPDRRLELALIGRNLTDKFVIQDAFSSFDSGIVATAFTGTAQGYRGDIGGTVSRGREVRLQLSFRM